MKCLKCLQLSLGRHPFSIASKEYKTTAVGKIGEFWFHHNAFSPIIDETCWNIYIIVQWENYKFECFVVSGVPPYIILEIFFFFSFFKFYHWVWEKFRTILRKEEFISHHCNIIIRNEVKDEEFFKKIWNNLTNHLSCNFYWSTFGCTNT